MTAMAVAALGSLSTRSKWAIPVAMLAVVEVMWGQMNPYPWNRFSAARSIRIVGDEWCG